MTDSFFNLAPVPYYLLDADGAIVNVNSKGAELIGKKKAALVHKVFSQYIFIQDHDKLNLCRMNLLENRQSQSCEARMFRSNGDFIDVRLDWSVASFNEQDHILLIITNITHQKQILDTQKFLLSNKWLEEGRDFFEALAEYLSRTLTVDYVCIDKIDDNNRAETVAVYYDGHFEDNIKYELKDTPCGKVLGNSVCSFPSNVRFLFPDDKFLQQMLAESYVGITLWGGNHTAIGLIEVIGRKPITNTEVIETILRQVSIRAAAELQYRALIERINRTYNALEKSSLAVLSATDEKQLLNDVCEIIVKDCGFSLVWIGYANEDEEKSVSVVASAGFDEGYLNSLSITWADTEKGRGPSGTTIRTGQVTMCRNMRTDPQFAPWRSEALKRGYESSVAFPLKTNDRTFGIVSIYSPYPDPFKEDEIRLLTKLSNDLAQGIITLRLRKISSM